MIRKATGEIEIRHVEIAIGPALTRAAFLESSLGQQAQVLVENEPYCSFDTRIPAYDLMPSPAVIVLYFHNQQLGAVSITATDDRFGRSWGDWSEAKERQRKKYHDQWLRQTVGMTTIKASWGELASAYDSKSGFSSIHLRYAW